ncbi:hypothetical protein BGW36DRAFT_74330 [Talaromyces proteolyticus]|uniref:GPI anchored protein n=1 Tax=Talaromyces proteolyticus TaxID=1131652 RepID=A0AAD4PRT0_9EURO|nr:uncharacterized protein BGW36DRAFT_74330 [Talaromyces proteolyticus]KAH8689654.1 hypothetical protein BGW36DRAFT_74330 [Talaromyces proteolyticus]
MRSFTSNLAVALLIVGSLAAGLDRRQDASSTDPDAGITITGNNQGNSGSATVVIANSIGNGVGDTTISVSNGVTQTASAAGTTITGDNQGNSGSATVAVSNGSSATQSASAQATSTSHGAAMGMGLEPTTLPLLAGGVLAAAANAVFLL